MFSTGIDLSRRDRLSKSQSEGYENVGKEGEEENGGVRGTSITK
jgi:hypothetical protein